MKLKTITSILLFSTCSHLAMADCQNAYQSEIKRLDGMLNPARTAFATSGATAVGVTVALVASGTALSAASVIAAPAAVLGAGTYYAVIGLRKSSLDRTLQLLDNSVSGKGYTLERFEKYFDKKSEKLNIKASDDDIVAAIQKLNHENKFCVLNKKGKPKLLTYLDAKKLILADFLENK